VEVFCKELKWVGRKKGILRETEIGLDSLEIFWM
jgi:hypothetical protein